MHSPSRGEIEDMAGKIAYFLRKKLEIPEDARVAVIAPNSTVYLPVILGIVKAGLTAVPLNPTYSVDELEHPVVDSDITAFFVFPPIVGNVHAVLERTGRPKTTPNGELAIWFMDEADKVSQAKTGERDFRTVLTDWLPTQKVTYPRDKVAVIVYSSGTSGKPKGVQRDVGGYAVAMALSMWSIYDIRAGQVMFSTSDVGWAVGHSYNVYGPLIAGATSILYEGLPTTPDPGIWWKICADYRVRTMFSSPTGIRVLKKQDPEYLARYDLSELRYLFLAGEPLDEPTASWISEGLGGTTIIDNYWQTETGWPVLALMPGVVLKPVKFGSPGLPTPGFDLRVIDESTGARLPPGTKGVLVIRPPLPPGCMTTVWNDDARFLSSYFSHFKELLYSSLDWAIQDEDGYTFILGRTDDVINVAGHRLGTREIEEAVSSHPAVAEAAVIGVADELKGQVPVVFATLRQTAADTAAQQATAAEMMRTVADQLGAVARPARVYVVTALPKTRSGKLLRRSLQALAEARDPGDLSTLDDPNALEDVRRVLERGADAG